MTAGETPKPGPPPAALKPGPPPARSQTCLWTVQYRSSPVRTHVTAARAVTEDGWLRLADDDGDVAVFPAEAVQSCVRRPRGHNADDQTAHADPR